MALSGPAVGALCGVIVAVLPGPGSVPPDAPPPPAIVVPSDPGPPDSVPPDPSGGDQPPGEAPPGGPGQSGSGTDLGAFFVGLTWVDHGAFGLDRATLVRDLAAPEGRLLRVWYPAGSASPEAARRGARPGGAQAYLRLPQPADAMTLTYSVRFPARFDFVKGGKLPGLFGGDAGSGGRHQPAGFSTRFMWRAGGAGEVYAYLPNDSGHGASLGRGRWRFPTGEWTRIAQRVALNTPGRDDGTVTVWVNGREVFAQGGLVYRDSDRVHVDGLFFSTFFGGGDSSWASPTDQYADFAGFSLASGQTAQPAGL
jgi:hypothetical protein